MAKVSLEAVCHLDEVLCLLKLLVLDIKDLLNELVFRLDLLLIGLVSALSVRRVGRLSCRLSLDVSEGSALWGVRALLNVKELARWVDC